MSSEHLQRLNDERTFDSLENYYNTKKQNKKENLWVLILPGELFTSIFILPFTLQRQHPVVARTKSILKPQHAYLF